MDLVEQHEVDSSLADLPDKEDVATTGTVTGEKW